MGRSPVWQLGAGRRTASLHPASLRQADAGSTYASLQHISHQGLHQLRTSISVVSAMQGGGAIYVPQARVPSPRDVVVDEVP